MDDAEPGTLEALLVDQDATRAIEKAVGKRHAIARKYVMWLRRRHPEATPADVIRMLERHYAASVSASGALVTAGTIAANVGISMLVREDPDAGPSDGVAGKAARATGREAARLAARSMAVETAKAGAQQAAALIPAGDQRLQFELTAVFALALADIHGLRLDDDQAHALVYGLSNGQISQRRVAAITADVAARADGAAGVGRKIADGRKDWSHWPNTLSDMLPGGAAQTLVRTIQSSQLDDVREGLSSKQQATIEYGMGAAAGGVTRFVFGRAVVDAARSAFAEAPIAFPAHLAAPVPAREADADVESSRAFVTLQEAARSTSGWIAGAAESVGGSVTAGVSAVGAGVANAAGTVSRPFRRATARTEAASATPDEGDQNPSARSERAGRKSAAAPRAANARMMRRRGRMGSQDGALVLCVAPGVDMVHTQECPHLTKTGLAALVPATPEQLDVLPVCTSCRSQLDGARRRGFDSLDSALEAFQTPIENRQRIREIAAALDYSRVWIPASGSYVGIAGAPGTPAVAYFGKGYADVHQERGYAREWLPVNGAGGRGSSPRSAREREVAVCPTCSTALPATGVCDGCDA